MSELGINVSDSYQPKPAGDPFESNFKFGPGWKIEDIFHAVLAICAAFIFGVGARIVWAYLCG